MTYVATPGHTPGHMAVGIENGGQQLIVGGDVLTNNAISFAKPEWRVGADFDRDQGIATRKQLLDQLATDRIPLIGFHLSWPGSGMVERQRNRLPLRAGLSGLVQNKSEDFGIAVVGIAVGARSCAVAILRDAGFARSSG